MMLGALSNGITILVGCTAVSAPVNLKIRIGHACCRPAVSPAREDNSKTAAVGISRPLEESSCSAQWCTLSVQQAPHDVADTSAIDVSAPAQVVLPAGALLKPAACRPPVEGVRYKAAEAISC